MKKIALCIALWIGIGSSFVAAEEGKKVDIDITAKAAVVINIKTGEVLYEKNAYEKAYPASITKVLTAILLEENMKANEVAITSDKAAHEAVSNWHFRLDKGEEIDKENALNVMMMLSSNDVAMAVAEHIGGSKEGFSELMNEKATEIGATNSHFTTPNGLHEEEHYTTAYDMALIGREASLYPFIMKAMSQPDAMIKTDSQNVSIERRDKIQKYEYAVAGKTGFTNKAGNTLLQISKDKDKEIVGVVMGSDSKQHYSDMKKISDYAFSIIKTKSLFKKGDVVGDVIINEKKASVVTSQDLSLQYNALRENSTFEMTPDIVADDKIEKKGVKKGEFVGNLLVKRDDELLATIPLLAGADIKPVTAMESVVKDLQKTTPEWVVMGSILLIMSAIVFCLFQVFTYYRDEENFK